GARCGLIPIQWCGFGLRWFLLRRAGGADPENQRQNRQSASHGFGGGSAAVMRNDAVEVRHRN
ncbi:MAG: hypothetical protein ACO288_02855, partial [Ilumatobacteraceae bacterium]